MTLTHPGPFTDVKKLFGKNGDTCADQLGNISIPILLP